MMANGTIKTTAAELGDTALPLCNSVRFRASASGTSVNQYALLAHLGQGAYAEVLLAEDLSSGNLVVSTEPTMLGVLLGNHPARATRERAGHIRAARIPPLHTVQAVKCFSKSRLLKKRDIYRTANGTTKVITALDKVQSEIVIMHALRAHDRIVALREVLTEPLKDELYLGESVLLCVRD